MREEKEHREVDPREPPAVARPPARACACRPSHARAGRQEEEARVGRQEEEARRRVDPLASARRKKPRRRPDLSSAAAARWIWRGDLGKSGGGGLRSGEISSGERVGMDEEFPRTT